MDRLCDTIDFRDMCEEFGITVRDMHRFDQLPAPWIDFEHDMGVEIEESLIHGKGLFARMDLEAGDCIAPASVGHRMTPAGRFVNHAKKPNARLDIGENGDLKQIAIAPIESGDEVTNDYRENAVICYRWLTGMRNATAADVKEALSVAAARLR